MYRASTDKRPTMKALLDAKHNYFLSSPQKSASGSDLTSKVQNPDDVGGVDKSMAPDDDKPVTVVDEIKGSLGWREGVLIPVLLNIWGVIMFLRLGWVAGQAGLGYATLIIVASNVVTTITALSLCAITTNGIVAGGGAYYLISRALGPAFGGAIGVLFYVAQAIAVSMYVVGFAESLLDIFKQGGAEPFTGDWAWDQRIVGLITTTVLLGIALIGVSWYAKFQTVLLGILLLAMASVVIGAFIPEIPDAVDNAARGFVGLGETSEANLDPGYTVELSTLSAQGFFSVFAVFFPAVTGIMAGANMSGDLADPSSAIPRGTLMGIAVTFVSYLALLWLVGSVCERCVGDTCSDADYGSLEWAERVAGTDDAPTGGLVYNTLIMQNMSLFGPLVYAGVFAATLSSALASLVGAPRILQALARDNLFPILFPFSQDDRPGEPQDREPIRGYFLTYIVGMVCVLIGELNLIAPLISNFFMIAYALTNYATFESSMAEAPGWRPTFPYYHPYLSAVGAFLCVGIMFAFDWLASLISVVVGVALYQYVGWSKPDVPDWGPAGNARKYIDAVNAMSTLVSTEGESQHVKSFRPAFLVLTGEVKQRAHLARFASRLYKGRGIMVCGDIVLPGEAGGPDDAGPEGDDTAAGAAAIRRADTDAGEKIHDIFEKVQARRKAGLQFLRSEELGPLAMQRSCFMEAVYARNVRVGLINLMTLAGMGGLRTNTVVMGFKKDWYSSDKQDIRQYEVMMTDVLFYNAGLVVLRDDDRVFGEGFNNTTPFEEIIVNNIKAKHAATKLSGKTTGLTPVPRPLAPGERPVIDVWWLTDDGGLTILLPHMLKLSSQFKGYDMRVVTTGDWSDPTMSRIVTKRESTLIHALSMFRIKATVEVVQANPQQAPSQESIDHFMAVLPDCEAFLPESGWGGPFPRSVVPKGVESKHEAAAAAAEADAAASPVMSPTEGAGMEHARIPDDGDGVFTGTRGGAGDSDESKGDLQRSKSVDEREEAVAMANAHRQTRLNVRLGEIIRNFTYQVSERRVDLVFVTLPLPVTRAPPRTYLAWLEALSRDMPPTVLMRGNNTDVLTMYS